MCHSKFVHITNLRVLDRWPTIFYYFIVHTLHSIRRVRTQSTSIESTLAQRDLLAQLQSHQELFTWLVLCSASQIAKFMWPTWGPPGSCRPQMGPMLAPRTLLSGFLCFGVGVFCIFLSGLLLCHSNGISQANHVSNAPRHYLAIII